MAVHIIARWAQVQLRVYTQRMHTQHSITFSLTKYPFDSISWNWTGIFVRKSGIFSDRVPFGGKMVKNAFSWSIQKCLVSMQAIYQQFYVDKISEIITKFLNWENVSAKTPKSKNKLQLNGFFTQNSISS